MICKWWLKLWDDKHKPWNSIIQGHFTMNGMKRATSLSLGNGAKAFFRKDRWASDSALSSLSNNLFSLATSQRRNARARLRRRESMTDGTLSSEGLSSLTWRHHGDASRSNSAHQLPERRADYAGDLIRTRIRSLM